MKKWEYMEVFQVWHNDATINRDPVPTLNELGQQGWELVHMLENDEGRTMYLKRPIATDKKAPGWQGLVDWLLI
jgi:hypothetical protein